MLKLGWRPENWYNPNRYWDGESMSDQNTCCDGTKACSCFDSYEKGADAMLKAILVVGAK